MQCPVDKTEMIIVEHRKIELDFCVECYGVWFDSGELELLIERLKTERPGKPESELLNQQDTETTEAKRKCPVCRKNMKKIWMGKEPGILIDSCPNGHGLWFDGGELNQFIGQLKTGRKDELAPKDILSFLEDTFLPVEKPLPQNKKKIL
jgi:uncharacterized protein